MANISTHILDTMKGLPAPDVSVKLEVRDPDGSFSPVGAGRTDADGRVGGFLADGQALEPGVFRLTFGTAEYFEKLEVQAFYPEVQLLFEVFDGARHHHVPLLLNPFGFTTYRGS